MVFSIFTYVHIQNVYYYPEIDSNLFSLSVFGTTDCEFHIKKEILHVIDTVENTILQSKCKRQVYLLLQFTPPEHYFSTSVHAHKITKTASIDFLHQCAGHVNKKT